MRPPRLLPDQPSLTSHTTVHNCGPHQISHLKIVPANRQSGLEQRRRPHHGPAAVLKSLAHRRQGWEITHGAAATRSLGTSDVPPQPAPSQPRPTPTSAPLFYASSARRRTKSTSDPDQPECDRRPRHPLAGRPRFRTGSHRDRLGCRTHDQAKPQPRPPRSMISSPDTNRFTPTNLRRLTISHVTYPKATSRIRDTS